MIKILKYGEVNNDEIFSRVVMPENITKTVANIINDVIADGDKAVRFFSKKFDKVDLDEIQVSDEEINEALEEIEPEFLNILKEAADNIRTFHINQKKEGFEIKLPDGKIMGQKVTPIEKAGLYVPGGTAAYPSTVLMDAIPAIIAGCSEVIIATPPNTEGKINPAILAAAKVSGVSKIFKVGGAQAIAALAYGTETIPKVEKIVGPGNAFVAEAKKQVFGKVSIDMIAGPSEILVLADEKSNPAWVAADLLSQAEHDKLSSAVLVTDSENLAHDVSNELEKQIPLLARAEIARASIDINGKIIITDSLDTAVEIANEIAPEHFEVCVDEPFEYIDKIKNAGSIFLGRNCPEALGDYFTGPNHTLPTMGTAKFSSPLSVDDFVKKTQYSYYTDEALKNVADKVAYFANKEGLTGHARSVTIRLEEY